MDRSWLLFTLAACARDQALRGQIDAQRAQRSDRASSAAAVEATVSPPSAEPSACSCHPAAEQPV